MGIHTSKQKSADITTPPPKDKRVKRKKSKKENATANGESGIEEVNAQENKEDKQEEKPAEGESAGAEGANSEKTDEQKDNDSVKKGETESAASGDAPTDIVEDSPDKEIVKDIKNQSSDLSTSVSQSQPSNSSDLEVKETKIEAIEESPESPKVEQSQTNVVEKSPEPLSPTQEKGQCQNEVTEVEPETGITTPPPTPAETVAAPENVPFSESSKTEEAQKVEETKESEITNTHPVETQENGIDAPEVNEEEHTIPPSQDKILDSSQEIVKEVPSEQNCVNGEIENEEEETAKTAVSTTLTWNNDGKEVSVSGDFNKWKECPLSEKDGIFSTRIDLPIGEHHYKFLVDGNWAVSENQPVIELDGHGQVNVLVVKAATEE